MTVVLAVGGHLLAEEGAESLRAAVAAFEGEPIVLTHGNGPQVGEVLLRDPGTPMHAAVARTQGELGSLLARLLDGVTLVTHVAVDEDDPAFAEPTKPIGPVYAQADAGRLEREHGWRLAEDPGRGLRRVVASPRPRAILELDAVRLLVDARVLAIACGGGGIPVAARSGGAVGLEAVVDKDHASALLGAALGARRLVVLTDVPAVFRAYGTPSEAAVGRLTPREATALLPELPEGSMRPKVEACAAFVEAGGGEALVTSAGALPEALAGRAGTRVAA